MVLCGFHGTDILCANVGDTRCVVGYKDSLGRIKTTELTTAHVARQAAEKARLELAKKVVKPATDSNGNTIGPDRVWVSGTSAWPGLSLSRSIGDTIAHDSAAVLSEPSVYRHRVSPEDDQYLILGSRGLFDLVSPIEAVSMTASQPSSKDACEYLLREAVKRWYDEERVYPDLTAMVLFLTPQATNKSRSPGDDE